MKDLPIELVGAVVQSVSSTSDLLSLRSINTTCHYLVTPHAFREIRIHNSIQSAQKCQSILASPSLSIHVRKVIYDPRDHAQFCLLPAGLQGDCDELEIADLEDALTETFCSLPGFKNLESIVLNFWPSFRSKCGTEIQEHPFWFTNRQVVILHAVHHAINMFPTRSLSLTLTNIILMSSTFYDFVSEVTNAPFHHFSMSVVANSELYGWSGSKAHNGSLSALLPKSNANLISLVLQSPQGLYHSRNTRLHFLHYPALETLVLENIVFDPTPIVDGVEEFILRHKASLRRLELRACSSYVPCLTVPVRRWSTIWARLEEELVSLTEIVVTDDHQGYALLDDARGFVPHPSIPTVHIQEDKESYVQFSSGVHRRSVLAQHTGH